MVVVVVVVAVAAAAVVVVPYVPVLEAGWGKDAKIIVTGENQQRKESARKTGKDKNVNEGKKLSE